MGWHISVKDLIQEMESVFTSAESEVRIGRDPFWVSLRLDQDGISRRHAILSHQDKSLFLEDLHSKNGSFVLDKGRWLQVTGVFKLSIPAQVMIAKRYELRIDFVSKDETITFSQPKARNHPEPMAAAPRSGGGMSAEDTATAHSAVEETCGLPFGAFNTPPRSGRIPIVVPPAPPEPPVRPPDPNPHSLPIPDQTGRAPARPARGAIISFTPLPVDSELDGRYLIQSVLGQGSFAFTYLAMDKILERQVAIKEFFPATLAGRVDAIQVGVIDQARREEFKGGMIKFLTEVRVMAKLNHPHLVSVFDHFEANQTAYYVMAYEQGQSLETVIHPGKRIKEHSILNLIHPMLDALEVVHQHGLIHRDIKPANIFLRTKGGPVLLDFGAARHAVSQTRQELTSMFTVGYAPFEQYDTDASQQGPWTDLYALAAVGFRLMTGQLPSNSQMRAACIMGQAPDPLPNLEQLTGRFYSSALIQAVRWGLAVEPRKRPQSVAEWRPHLPASPSAS